MVAVVSSRPHSYHRGQKGGRKVLLSIFTLFHLDPRQLDRSPRGLGDPFLESSPWAHKLTKCFEDPLRLLYVPILSTPLTPRLSSFDGFGDSSHHPVMYSLPLIHLRTSFP